MNEQYSYEIQERIHAYCLHRLSAQERTAFEAEMALSPQLQEWVQAYQRDVVPALDRMRMLQLKADIERWQTEDQALENDSANEVKRPKIWYWKWVLLLTALAALVGWWYLSVEKLSPLPPPTSPLPDTLQISRPEKPDRADALAVFSSKKLEEWRSGKFGNTPQVRSAGTTDTTTFLVDSLINAGKLRKALTLCDNIQHLDEQYIRKAYILAQLNQPDGAMRAYTSYKDVTGEQDDWLEILILLSDYDHQRTLFNQKLNQYPDKKKVVSLKAEMRKNGMTLPD